MEYTLRLSRDGQETQAQVLPDADAVAHEVSVLLENTPDFLRLTIEPARSYDKDL